MASTSYDAEANVTVLTASRTLAPLDDLRALARYRDLLYTLSLHRIKVRYKQSLLGLAWALLQPLALMLIYTLVFSLIARVESGAQPYAVFAFAGLLPWTFFTSAVASVTTSFVNNSTLVTKVYFPREILPLTYVIAALFDFAVASTLLVGLFVWYDLPLTLAALWAVPVMAVAAVLVTGVGLLLSVIQVRVRDVGVAVPLVLQVLMFASPVVYPLQAVPAWLRPWYDLNPLVGIVDGFRRAVLDGAAPDPRLLGMAAGLSIAVLLVAYVAFRRVQATMADVI
jgi:lipopolysaccharide transport system permease protein